MILFCPKCQKNVIAQSVYGAMQGLLAIMREGPAVTERVCSHCGITLWKSGKKSGKSGDV